jgi:GTP-binding protein
LTGSRDALVADFPGLTRDRIYGFAAPDVGAALLIDTGGLPATKDALARLIARQIQLAIDEADVIVVLVDGREGPQTEDQAVAELARRSGKPIVLAVNKVEGRAPEEVIAEYFELGIGTPHAISATRGSGVAQLFEAAIELCPASTDGQEAVPDPGLAIAIVGRPNVGKSTLINRYLREERLVTEDEPGTTRDSIRVPFEFEDKTYTLIDTAGIRRKARVSDAIEKFSVAKALQAVDEADAVIVLVDARTGITEQDVSLIGLIVERGRALTVGINKWDGLADKERRSVLAEFERALPFLDFADVHTISAEHGSKIFELFRSALKGARAANVELPTTRLTDCLRECVSTNPPPVVNRRRIKLNFAHQGGRRPPLIIVHGNQTDHLPASYRRYLVSKFRAAFRLRGTPIRLELRTGKNPFAGRRNELTSRQIRKRRRLRTRSRHGS